MIRHIKVNSRLLYMKIFLLILPFLLLGAIPAFAEINITSESLETASLLKIQSDDDASQINSVRIWTGDGYEFKSFTAESSWNGKLSAVGVLVFTTDIPLLPGESVKFGVITDNPNPTINYKILNNGDILKQGSHAVDNTKPAPEILKNNPAVEQSFGISDDSTIKIVPSILYPDSIFRIAGSGFVAGAELDISLDSTKLGSITTKSDTFVFTAKIPQGAKNKISIIIDDDKTTIEKSFNVKDASTKQTREPKKNIEPVNLPLKITSSDIDAQSKKPTVDGQYKGNRSLVVKIFDEAQSLLTTSVVRTDDLGKWKYDKPLPFSATGSIEFVIGTNGDVANQIFTLDETSIVDSNDFLLIAEKNFFENKETPTFQIRGEPTLNYKYTLITFADEILRQGTLNMTSAGHAALHFDDIKFKKGVYNLHVTNGFDEKTSFFGINLDKSSAEFTIAPSSKTLNTDEPIVLVLNCIKKPESKVPCKQITNTLFTINIFDSEKTTVLSEYLISNNHGNLVPSTIHHSLSAGNYTIHSQSGVNSFSATQCGVNSSSATQCGFNFSTATISIHNIANQTRS